MTPPAQQRRLRKLREAQEELAGETAFRIALSNLQEAVGAYRRGASKRTAPVMLELFQLFVLMRSFLPGRIPMRSAREALESMDGLLMESPPGRRPTPRQEALSRLLRLLHHYIPADGDAHGGSPLARGRDELREAWGRITRARLTPLIREASMAMLGLTALDILCRTRDDLDEAAAAVDLCGFAIGMLDGNDLADEEAVGNLYLIGAYHLDCLGMKEDCVRYLNEGRRRIDEGRARSLRIDEIIEGIRRSAASGKKGFPSTDTGAPE